jgi:hypothetical protein
MREGQKRWWFIATTAVTFLIVAGSAAWAQEISTNAMPGVSFGNYHTYKWVTIEGAKPPNQIVAAQIMDAVDAQLQAKGFTKVTGDNAPDMDVAYQVSVSQQTQWNAYNMGGGWGWGGMGTATSSTINNGTLVLDFYDPAKKQLIWQGRATKTLDESANENKKQKNLDNAMKKLLKNFPPK